MTAFQISIASSALAVTMVTALTSCAEPTDGRSPPSSAGSSAPVARADGPAAGSADEKNSTVTVAAPLEYSDPFAGTRAGAGQVREIAETWADELAPSGAKAAATGEAAQLRADLTYVLSEHTYVAALALESALRSGLDDPATRAAFAAMDRNSTGVADTIGRVTDSRWRDRFLTNWREYIDLLVGYATADSTSGERDRIAEIDAWENDTAALLVQITDGAIGPKVSRWSLDTNTTTMRAVVDALKDGSHDWAAKAAFAARDMVRTADLLADAFFRSGRIDSDPSASGAALRADLTGLLVGHVCLTNAAALAAFSDDRGAASPRFAATADALRANTGDLAAAVGAVAPQAEPGFADLWAAHTEHLLRYVGAVASGDETAAAEQLRELHRLPPALARVLAGRSDGDGEAQPAASLREHVRHLTGVIDAMARSVTAT